MERIIWTFWARNTWIIKPNRKKYSAKFCIMKYLQVKKKSNLHIFDRVKKSGKEI